MVLDHAMWHVNWILTKINLNDDVSSELVFVKWYFGDCHCDNSRAILDYNSS
jgi:hypothetical protein